MLSFVPFAVPALIAGLMTYLFVRPARAIAFHVGAIDQPGPRKIHKQPMPRLGGLAVVGGASVVFAAAHPLPAKVLLPIALGLLPVLIISFMDDIRSVRAMTKLIVHFAGAWIAVYGGIVIPGTVSFFGHDIRLGWLAVPISLAWIACVTNAFNIIDGLDGLSAGLALISSVSLAAVSIFTGHYAIASASMILAGSLTGFLPHNFYPARIFLGDTGATAIGFVLACLTLGGGGLKSAGLAVALPLLIVGVPLADTVISVLRRVAARFEGNSHGLMEPDSRHIHHRLLALGLNQRRAALTLYIAGAVLATTGLLSLFMEQRKAGLLLVAILAAAFVGIFKLGYDEFAVWRRGSLLKIYDAPVLRIGLFIAFVDISLVVIALYASTILKYDAWAWRGQQVQMLAILPGLTVSVFAAMGVYKCSWRNPNVQDMLKLAAATLTAAFSSFVVAAILLDSAATATFFVLYTMCLFALVAACRISYQVLCHWNQRARRVGEPVIIYGAGNSGSLALREMQANDGVPMIPVGFIDDDPIKRGRWINGYPVLGSVAALEDIVTTRKIRGVVVASEKIEISKLRHAQTLCRDSGLWIRRFRISFLDEFAEPARAQRGASKRPRLTADREPS